MKQLKLFHFEERPQGFRCIKKENVQLEGDITWGFTLTWTRREGDDMRIYCKSCIISDGVLRERSTQPIGLCLRVAIPEEGV